jgi:hypothetical protein
MKKLAALGLVVLALPFALSRVTGGPATAAADEGAKIVHDVYFSLKEDSADNRKKLVEACKKLLTNHPGEDHFAVGPRAEEFSGQYNDREFDVALHIVFKDKAAHDKYQQSPRHRQFIEENRESLKNVRVFDSEARE